MLQLRGDYICTSFKSSSTIHLLMQPGEHCHSIHPVHWHLHLFQEAAPQCPYNLSLMLYREHFHTFCLVHWHLLFFSLMSAILLTVTMLSHNTSHSLSCIISFNFLFSTWLHHQSADGIATNTSSLWSLLILLFLLLWSLCYSPTNMTCLYFFSFAIKTYSITIITAWSLLHQTLSYLTIWPCPDHCADPPIHTHPPHRILV